MDGMIHQHLNMTFAPPDMAELSTLYQQYAPALYAFLLKHVPDEEDAQDLTGRRDGAGCTGRSAPA